MNHIWIIPFWTLGYNQKTYKISYRSGHKTSHKHYNDKSNTKNHWINTEIFSESSENSRNHYIVFTSIEFFHIFSNTIHSLPRQNQLRYPLHLVLLHVRFHLCDVREHKSYKNEVVQFHFRL